jgi:hypothetical protein
VLASLEFLTPEAALIAIAVAAPLLAALALSRRAARARALLRLPDPGRAARFAGPVALCLLAALLAVAAAQPVVRTTKPQLARTDAEVMVAFDVSRSMLAAPHAGARTRLDRAKILALRLRAALPDVPTGVAAFTDRALPHLLPSPRASPFVATVERTVAIEQPPPRGTALIATTFDPLADLPSLYFSPNVRRRLVVVFTDGESTNVDGALLRRALRREGVQTIAIVVGSTDERVFDEHGAPEPEYMPLGREGVDRLIAATGGRAFTDAQVGAAVRAAREFVGRGRRRQVATEVSSHGLARYLVFAALAPLAFVSGRRVF